MCTLIQEGGVEWVKHELQCKKEGADSTTYSIASNRRRSQPHTPTQGREEAGVECEYLRYWGRGGGGGKEGRGNLSKKTFLKTNLKTYVKTYRKAYLKTHLKTYLKTCLKTYLKTWLKTFLKTYYEIWIILKRSIALESIPNLLIVGELAGLTTLWIHRTIWPS